MLYVKFRERQVYLLSMLNQQVISLNFFCQFDGFRMLTNYVPLAVHITTESVSVKTDEVQFNFIPPSQNQVCSTFPWISGFMKAVTCWNGYLSKRASLSNIAEIVNTCRLLNLGGRTTRSVSRLRVCWRIHVRYTRAKNAFWRML